MPNAAVISPGVEVGPLGPLGDDALGDRRRAARRPWMTLPAMSGTIVSTTGGMRIVASRSRLRSVSSQSRPTIAATMSRRTSGDLVGRDGLGLGARADAHDVEVDLLERRRLEPDLDDGPAGLDDRPDDGWARPARRPRPRRSSPAGVLVTAGPEPGRRTAARHGR